MYASGHLLAFAQEPLMLRKSLTPASIVSYWYDATAGLHPPPSNHHVKSKKIEPRNPYPNLQLSYSGIIMPFKLNFEYPEIVE